MAEAKTTTTPRRPRAAAAKTTTPRKAAPAKAAAPTDEADTAKVAFTLGEAFDVTKTYAKFDLKFDAEGNNTGCVGTVYAPLGTEVVRVQLVGPADVVAE